MIVKTLSEDEFINEFKSFSENYANKFSYDGLRALYNYLEDYSENIEGNSIELDVIALCCEYTEYKNFKELKTQYNNINGLNDLQDRTQYIPIYDFQGRELKSFIIQNF